MTACYSYRVAEPGEVRPGAQLRARISAVEAERIEQLLVGRSDARVLEGLLVQADSASLLLQVPSATRPGLGGGVEVLHQRVALPRAGVLEVELKQLDRIRTYGLIGAGPAAAAYIATSALNGEPGREGQPPGGGSPEFRIPLLRWSR